MVRSRIPAPNTLEGLVRQSGPMQGGFPVTPDDDLEFQETTRVLYVGTTGNIKLQMINGDVILRAFEQGYHPLAVKKVFSTGTTASNIWGHY